MTGYSDPIHHALALAAKHHDQQVRKGAAHSPYLIASPNVAVILTRYEQDDATVVAGILRDMVSDFVRDGYTAEMLTGRVSDKFSAHLLALLLYAVERRYDDQGVELSAVERRADFLERLADADVRARWVVAAHLVHSGSTLLADLRRTEFPESVWGRAAAGERPITWYSEVCARLIAVGFDAPIMDELRDVVESLDALAASRVRR